MKKIFVFLLLVCILGCEHRLSYEEAQDANKNLIENQLREDLNYDLALCESFVKDTKYKFINISDLINILFDADGIKRGEYETSQQFDIRKQKEQDKKIKKIKNKTGSDYILYSTKNLQTYYDADLGLLYVKNQAAFNGVVFLDDSDNVYDFGSEIKQNAFGAKVEVSNVSIFQKVIYLSPFSDRSLYLFNERHRSYPLTWKERLYWPSSNPISISVAPDKAKQLRNNLRMLIVADPHETPVQANLDHYDATFSMPSQIMGATHKVTLKPITACYYNQKTKEVYNTLGNTGNIRVESDAFDRYIEKFR